MAGLILSTMAFDYINTNSAKGANTDLDIVISALTSKNTTAGPGSTDAMLWLFVGTILVMVVIGIAEWGHNIQLSTQEWLIATGLLFLIALGIFSAFIFVHIRLIATSGAGLLDALTTAVAFFVLFMALAMAAFGLSLLLYLPLPVSTVARPSNIVVGPALALIAAILILESNVKVVQADMVYKQGVALSDQNNPDAAVAYFQQALSLQPNQDYYDLFLGRSLLDSARAATDTTKRDAALNQAQQVLLRALQLNPLNTDHSANLARLHQQWAALLTDPAQKAEQYKQALDYFQDAIKLSPNTVHLYDQYAQALMDYADFQTAQKNAAAAGDALGSAQAQLARSLQIDPTFCYTFATKARADSDWSNETKDALQAIRLAPGCSDVFQSEGRALASNALADAGDRAVAAGQGAAFAQQLADEAKEYPSLEIYTALTNYYSKAGQIDQAIAAVDKAIGTISENDSATRQRYQDFRNQLVALQNAIKGANASPNDATAQKNLAAAWLARSQFALALQQYQKVVVLTPNDYNARRQVALLMIVQGQWAGAQAALTQAAQLAPDSDRAFWQKLATLVVAAQAGPNAQGLADAQALAKTVDAGDLAANQALNTLQSKLK